MKKFKLESWPGNAQKHISPWIRVYNLDNDLLCIIFADGRVSTAPEEWHIEELKHFIFIAEHFEIFFEPLEELAREREHIKDQDGIIRQLQDEVHYLTHNLEKA